MQDRPITDFMRPVRVLLPDDPIAKAASLMRAAGIPELPVINYGRVVGVIREADMLAQLADDDNGMNKPVSQVMRPEPVMANKYMSLQQVSDIFARGDMAVLPVVDEYGAYEGLLTRADVVALSARVLRPANVAGMATPLGVHLTTGNLSAGAGSLGLYLSGVVLGIFVFLASASAYGIGWLVESATGLPVRAFLESTPLPFMNALDVPSYFYTGIQLLMILVFLRLSPLASYHAAEHMVVHAMEQGEQIEPETVKLMPRVHPRCGTNLLAAATIFTIITVKFSSFEAVMLAIVILVLGWRTAGGYLQYYFTTRRPGDKHVANGVKTANELLDKYQEQPNLQVSGMQRIWNIGLLQTAAGVVSIYFVLSLLVDALHLSAVLLP